MKFKKYNVSRNLWNEDYTGISSTLKYVPVFVGDGIFTLSTSCPIIGGAAALFFIAGNVQSGASTSTNGVYYGKPITVTASDGYVTVVFRYVNYQSGAADPRNEKTMLNTGSTPLPYSSEVWHDTPHYIHNTSTDTITTLPADIYANDTTATVGLKGNMNQSSTPTPDNPIMPQGTGERTGNLWDEDYTGISGYLKYVPVFVGEGTFTLSTDASDYLGNAPLFLLSGNVASGASTPVNGVFNRLSRTTDSSNGYITIAFRLQSESSNPMTHKTMLNTGSTALPYEPYGYKIPISSANTTTPVYLGEVETTRKIKKLVLTGTASDGNTAITAQGIIYITPMTTLKNIVNGYCTHYKFVNQPQGSSMPLNSFTTSGGAGTSLWFKTEFDNVADFKAYLAAQYAAGTPVTVWYVLANEKTAVVNEPLMKIGKYADEVSGITIPTIAGANTLSVDTTLQPSEVSVNYKGWHPISEVHEKSME